MILSVPYCSGCFHAIYVAFANTADEGVKNVTDSDVKPELKRGHYAVEVDLPPVTEIEQEPRTVIHVKRANMFDFMG